MNLSKFHTNNIKIPWIELKNGGKFYCTFDFFDDIVVQKFEVPIDQISIVSISKSLRNVTSLNLKEIMLSILLKFK